ncbi:MAG: FG-GAP repeat domain-containing protein [Candidatus Geothermincolia bacterium]
MKHTGTRRDIPVILVVTLLLLSISFLFPAVAKGDPYPSHWETQWTVDVGTMFKHASPTLADIDGNGYQEIIIGNYNGRVYCFDSWGNERWNYDTGASVESTPLVVDVDGNGKMEIFVGSDNGWTYGLDWQGKPLSQWGWPKYTGVIEGFTGVFTAPAAGDLDGDGDLEIVVGTWSHLVYAWHYQGDIVANFPFDNYDTIWSSPALADIDLDGMDEIIIGADVTGAYWWYPPGGLMWVLKGDGSSLPGYPKWIRQVIWSSPGIADLNADGFPDIVVGTGHYYGEDVAQGDGYKVYAWDHLGNALPGWPVSTGDNNFSSPAIADIDGDGRFEVVMASLDGWVYCWEHDGKLKWQRQRWEHNKLASPVIGDINSDGVLDIVIGDSWDVTAWDANGNLVLSQWVNGIVWSTAALGDIDMDGRIEIVVGTGAGGEGGTLYCFEAGTYNASRVPWPMFRRDAAHSSGYPHEEQPDLWSAAEIRSEWYLAEGYTGPGFDEWILIMNPLDVPARMQLRYLLPSGMSVVRVFDVAPHSRFTTLVNNVIPNSDVSVAAISSEPGLVVERAMYFNYQGKTGGTSVVGIDEPHTTWYLAEGYTGGTFDTYVLLANPNQNLTADVYVTYMTDSGPVDGGHYQLAPKSRKTIHVDALLPAHNVSTRVISSVPIVCERAMYFIYGASIDGGHGAKAVSQPGFEWYMAEGYTAGSFDTWLLVQNPNGSPAEVVATFMKPGGVTQDFAFTVAANSRYTTQVDGIPGLEATEFSIRVTADRPVIAERAMYFNYNGFTGGHDVIGASRPAMQWSLAEGCTAFGFDTFILIQNPSTQPASVHVEFLASSGQVLTHDYVIDPQARFTIWCDAFPGLEQAEFSTIVTAGSPVIVERAMYFLSNGKDGGHATLGHPSL